MNTRQPMYTIFTLLLPRMFTRSSGLRQMSVSELTETLEEVEAAIRRYSEELIQALALRDELDYEKEVL